MKLWPFSKKAKSAQDHDSELPPGVVLADPADHLEDAFPFQQPHSSAGSAAPALDSAGYAPSGVAEEPFVLTADMMSPPPVQEAAPPFSPPESYQPPQSYPPETRPDLGGFMQDNHLAMLSQAVPATETSQLVDMLTPPASPEILMSTPSMPFTMPEPLSITPALQPAAPGTPESTAWMETFSAPPGTAPLQEAFPAVPETAAYSTPPDENALLPPTLESSGDPAGFGAPTGSGPANPSTRPEPTSDTSWFSDSTDFGDPATERLATAEFTPSPEFHDFFEPALPAAMPLDPVFNLETSATEGLDLFEAFSSQQAADIPLVPPDGFGIDAMSVQQPADLAADLTWTPAQDNDPFAPLMPTDAYGVKNLPGDLDNTFEFEIPSEAASLAPDIAFMPDSSSGAFLSDVQPNEPGILPDFATDDPDLTGFAGDDAGIFDELPTGFGPALAETENALNHEDYELGHYPDPDGQEEILVLDADMDSSLDLTPADSWMEVLGTLETTGVAEPEALNLPAWPEGPEKPKQFAQAPQAKTAAPAEPVIGRRKEQFQFDQTVPNPTPRRSAADALDDLEQQMLLEESRFLKRSIDQLVSRYFAQEDSSP